MQFLFQASNKSLKHIIEVALAHGAFTSTIKEI